MGLPVRGSRNHRFADAEGGTISNGLARRKGAKDTAAARTSPLGSRWRGRRRRQILLGEYGQGQWEGGRSQGWRDCVGAARLRASLRPRSGGRIAAMMRREPRRHNGQVAMKAQRTAHPPCHAFSPSVRRIVTDSRDVIPAYSALVVVPSDHAHDLHPSGRKSREHVADKPL